MDITVTDVTASAGVAFAAPVPRSAPAPAGRPPTRAVAPVEKAPTAPPADSEAEPAQATPPLPMTAQRAALGPTPGSAADLTAAKAEGAAGVQALRAYALTLTDALWQMTKSFRQVL